MANKDAICLDSETSVDYYVTTVNENEPKKSDLSESNNIAVEPPTPTSPKIVVSVDRAGCVKVRKRKKSKRRKKKSNLALDDLALNHSEDETRVTSSASDASQNKVPKRSISLNERDLVRNTKVVFSKDAIPTETKVSVPNGTSLHQNEQVPVTSAPVRRRPKKKSSFRNNRRGFIEGSIMTGSENAMSSQENNRPHQDFEMLDSSNDVTKLEYDVTKAIKQKDALATLTLFMQDVEEATTVAKQQLEDRRKDPMLRRSRSMTDILGESDVYATDSCDGLRLKSEPPFPHKPQYSHQKQMSLDQKSVVSGSVFTSDHDVSVEDGRDHPVLTPQSSSSGSKEKRSRSLYDLVMATDTDVLTEILYKKVSHNKQGKIPLSHMNARHDSDYGLAHLEQMCKMIEQIGDLRKQNTELKKTITNLEQQIVELKSSKDETTSYDPRLSFPPVMHKRGGRVDRIKDAISRSRRSSMEKGQFVLEHGTISQPMMINQSAERNESSSGATFGSSLPSTGSPQPPTSNPVIFSNINLKKPRRRQYARDDLDLTKNRWKFWKAPVRQAEPSNSKKQVVTSIKAEHMQGSAVHLKSASVTLDSLLKNIDNDFSQKMITWQAAAKPSRAPSRASESSAEPINRNLQSSSSAVCLPSSDESVRYRHHRNPSDSGLDRSKESFKKKLSRWERKLTSRKISWHGDYRRSKSVERVNETSYNDTPPRSYRLRSASTTLFHQSMPCVNLPDVGDEDQNQLKEDTEPLNSTEWSALQEAFPTNSTPVIKTSAHTDPLRRFISASQSRLAAPLRKKNGKRRSWSFAKRATSHYYLPSSGDFLAESNVGAGSLANQLTLELDQEDVQAVTQGLDRVNDEEIKYLNKNTKELRDKLSVIEKEWPTNAGNGKATQRPASSMARLNEGRSALSSRRSRPVAILRLSSCEALNTGPQMSPLLEEAESIASFRSLPNFDDIDYTPNDPQRRHTVTIIDVSPKLSPDDTQMSRSAPAIVDGSERTIKPVVSFISQRTASKVDVTSTSPVEKSVTKWVSTSMLHYHAKPLLSSDTESLPERSPSRIYEKRSKFSKGGVFRHLHKLSPKFKRRENQRTGSETSNAEDSDGEHTSGSTKSISTKRKFKILRSFRRSKSNTKKKEPQDLEADSSPLPPVQVRKQHFEQIVENNRRYSAESRSRKDSNSPTAFRKGIVSRLSKRFSSRASFEEKQKEEKTEKNSKGVFAKTKTFFEPKPTHERSASFNKLETNNNNNNNNNAISSSPNAFSFIRAPKFDVFFVI
uniref:uncharacterized protein LOC100176418 isoform X3 n=1 Tax=Ciona intestinalis TaxID=7719 RepID=UPI00089DABA1|nr:uncharacterized protein LOC100176418 isoform X3 [Ciona intestinalis]|eukprot:XP_018668125.1 uncharacterized protein LOC100176418 isoform X3 [Ciona intestinalis]